jgi:hypothetical protein
MVIILILKELFLSIVEKYSFKKIEDENAFIVCKDQDHSVFQIMINYNVVNTSF